MLRLQKVLLLLLNFQVHYSVHKSLATGSCPEAEESSPQPPPNFPQIHSNIIFPFTPRSFERYLPFRFSNQNIL